MTGATRPARGLLVGRFQPFHRGHLGVVGAIRRGHPDEELILAIGSAQESFTPSNPFTASERFEMIHRALREAKQDGCLVVPLPDVQRHAVWVAHTEELLPPFGRVHTNNPLTAHLFGRAGYPVEAPAWIDREHLEGRTIRRAMMEATGWESAVPPAVAGFLVEIEAPRRLRELDTAAGARERA